MGLFDFTTKADFITPFFSSSTNRVNLLPLIGPLKPPLIHVTIREYTKVKFKPHVNNFFHQIPSLLLMKNFGD